MSGTHNLSFQYKLLPFCFAYYYYKTKGFSKKEQPNSGFTLFHCFIVNYRSPLILESYAPKPQWIPGTADNTEPYVYISIHTMFPSYTRIPMIKFNLQIRYSKILTTIIRK